MKLHRSEKLVALEEEKTLALTKIEEKEKKLKDYAHQINELGVIAENEESVRRRCTDELQYHKLGRDMESVEQRISILSEEISAIVGAHDIQKLISDLESKKLALQQERSKNDGKMSSTQQQLKEIRNRLKESHFRKIHERTRLKRVEVETTVMAVEDLDKYWIALDKALLRYHSHKIQEINRIIRELWSTTYMGQDIDSIEIVSGEEGASTRASRSYNYRVAMRKGDTTLDMKGRCSAGQRVLACIVIRLALAETFCLTCGILTLDEPTTNLDEYNKQGLASALADIISIRAKQRNFQVIVITHDPDFVNYMRSAFNQLGTQRAFNLPEYYWRIFRSQVATGQYVSQIERIDWDEL
uniref:RecF/RecN/SMC N-terminal domain-containing protein n=1 Tax=Octactis speculum TaxID=3111310 RepID=A0A7S2B1T5_9STRA